MKALAVVGREVVITTALATLALSALVASLAGACALARPHAPTLMMTLMIVPATWLISERIRGKEVSAWVWAPAYLMGFTVSLVAANLPLGVAEEGAFGSVCRAIQAQSWLLALLASLALVFGVSFGVLSFWWLASGDWTVVSATGSAH